MIYLHKQRGLTLLELIMSMALSVVVVFAVGSILMTSNQAASVSDTVADSQETGRFTVDFMNKQLLRTGYDPEELGFIPFKNDCQSSDDIICINEATTGTGDRIAVRRVAQPNQSNAVTCYGSKLLDKDEKEISVDVVVTDVYWVEVDDEGLSSLRCQTFDENGTVLSNPRDSFGDPESLAAGVIAMHVLYGQSTVAPVEDTFNVSRYYNANQVTDWGSVYALRIGFLTQALSTTDAQVREKNYTILDSLGYQFKDQTARQIFTTTITLLN